MLHLFGICGINVDEGADMEFQGGIKIHSICTSIFMQNYE